MTWREEIDHFRSTFDWLAQQRPQRQILDPRTGVCGWYHFELLEMWLEVNRRRKLRGWDVVPMSKVEQVEQQAAGHVDYSSKYAIGCATLAYYEGA